MDTLGKQVNRDAYRFERYGEEDRFVSYAHQLQEIGRVNPKRMLEVGVGDGTIKHHVTSSGIEYVGVDIADDVGADYIGSVTALPFPDDSFDLACAFEVLEHLPFDQFSTALKELARVSKKDVLISLPHFGPPVKLLFKIPFMREVRVAFKIPYPRVHAFDGQHYWEIGKKGYSLARVKSVIAEHFVIERDFVPFNNQYHHFFVLTTRSDRKPMSR